MWTELLHNFLNCFGSEVNANEKQRLGLKMRSYCLLIYLWEEVRYIWQQNGISTGKVNYLTIFFLYLRVTRWDWYSEMGADLLSYFENDVENLEKVQRTHSRYRNHSRAVCKNLTR